MKIYKRELKWKDKVNWRKVIILFFIMAIVGFLMFYFVIGGKTLLGRAIITSLIIAVLLTISNILTSIIKYDDFIVLVDNKKKYLICDQDENFFFDVDGKPQRVRRLKNDKEVLEVFNDLEKNIGLDIYEIDKYDIIKREDNYMTLELHGSIKKWDRKIVKRRCEFSLIEEKEDRIITIDNRFDKYDELVKTFK